MRKKKRKEGATNSEEEITTESLEGLLFLP